MNTEHFKEKLQAELATVTRQLSDLSHTDIDPTATEKDEIADRFEDQEEQRSEKASLEARKVDIEDALHKIESGTYGICEVSGEPIEEERLEANPAARTCTAHM